MSERIHPAASALRSGIAVVAGVAIGFGAAWFLKPQPPAKDVPRAGKQDDSADEHRLADYKRSLTDIWQRMASPRPALTDGDIITLKSMADACGRTSFQDRRHRAQAAFIHAAASWTLQLYRPALESSDRAVEEHIALLEEFPDPAIQLEAAVTHCLRCSIFADLGRFSDATESAILARDILNSIPPIDATAAQVPGLLSNCLRSLAILEAAQGRSGVAHARESLEAASRERGSTAYRQVVDARLILAQQLFLVEKTEDAFRQLNMAMADLKRVSEDFENRRRAGEETPSVTPVVELQHLIRNVLEQAPESFEWKDDLSPSTLPLPYLPVRRIVGITLHPDLLMSCRLPAEFEHQQAFALVWRGEPWEHAAVTQTVKLLARSSRVYILVAPSESSIQCRDMIHQSDADLSNIRIIDVATNSRWLRDYGPMGVRLPDNGPAFLDARYSLDPVNPRPADELVPFVMGHELHSPVVATALFVQGGELATNGDGLCVASEMLLKRNVRAGMSEDFVRATLRRLTGATSIVFVEALNNEPTQHVDWFLTFTSTDTVFVGEYADSSEENAALLDRNASRLASLKTANGPLRVVRVPMPPQQDHWFGGTYTNVVYTDHCVLVPDWKYAPKQMRSTVAELYKKHLPGRTVEFIPSDLFGFQQGALHCLVLNIPAVSSPDDGTEPLRR